MKLTDAERKELSDLVNLIKTQSENVALMLADVKKFNQKVFERDLRHNPNSDADWKANTKALDQHMDADMWEYQAKIHLTEGFAALVRALTKPEGMV